MLYKPFAATCRNRKKLAEKHQIAGDPEDWLTNDLLSKYSIRQISFDFFVDWSNWSVSSEIWVKRLADDEKIDVNPENLQSLIYRCDGGEFVTDLAKFVGENKLTYKIFREGTDWNSQLVNPTSKPILDVEIDAQGKVIEVKKLEVVSLMQQIRNLSGGPVRVGGKGLNIAFTDLECFLSRTDAAWPGDVDMMLVNDKNEVLAILEFKKHTLYDAIENHTFDIYYPNKDKRKYDRLALLRDAIKGCPPIIVIYYPTKEHIDNIIIEKIYGQAGKLHSSDRVYLDLPIETRQKEILLENIFQMLSVGSE
ncbi:hypothetical protein [Bacillus anthracis]|uniref:hypothetical protein n=1 Tax=Bacillus anthracis TaxID=1392 RepID=UPI00099CA657|nr:hypothetical protein [Bacillus anthracis]OPD59425.1 hypothetical protein BVG01_07900 [Bacillus anthracis]